MQVEGTEWKFGLIFKSKEKKRKEKKEKEKRKGGSTKSIFD